jgi:hypothetical protein
LIFPPWINVRLGRGLRTLDGWRSLGAVEPVVQVLPFLSIRQAKRAARTQSG